MLVETPEAEQEEVSRLVVDTMRAAAALRVPLEVNLSVGRTWAAAKG